MSRHIPDPGFAGDDGTADSVLVDALAAWAAGGSPDPVYASLVGGRVMVPVVARAVNVDVVTGADKETDMMLVTIRGEDGRIALPAFTSLAALVAWNDEARPVPVAASTACLSTVAEQGELLILDPGGPVTFAVEGPALRALAQGRVPVPPLADPEVAAAVAEVAAGEPAITRHRLVASEAGADAVLVFGLRADVDPTGVARTLASALAAHPVLRERLDLGLELAYLPNW
ncbi:SseB family protein [Sporichthya sp.]|uniref:SseB family protein n=1 Tax=Sporichthya sp. TaxID=65475 RepID=UPI00180E8D89|nr:SseB family protein [Sporichthya sp.]MBA3744447.1 SseB family protein [Sporichthya sp.]